MECESKVLVDGAQILTGVCAVVALGYTAIVSNLQGRSADLAAILTVVERVTQAERRLSASVKDEAEFGRNFAEYANELELLATCFNAGMFRGAPKQMARHHLVSSIAIINTISGAKDLFEKMHDSPNTFSALINFMRVHRRDIKKEESRRSS